MVAPIGQDLGVLIAPAPPELVLQRRERRVCSKKTERVALALIFGVVDAICFYFSVNSWKQGDRQPLIITSTVNLTGVAVCIACIAMRQ